jgi:hypothetical protein
MITDLPRKRILISIIIPTFNAAHYLEELLPAIARQTFQQYEILTSRRTRSLAQAICGWTRPPRPQSVPAMTFSWPTISANVMMRSASSSGCSTSFAVVFSISRPTSAFETDAHKARYSRPVAKRQSHIRDERSISCGNPTVRS